MKEILFQTADARDYLSDSGCGSLSIRHRMQATLYQTADAGDTLSDSGTESPYQTADAGDSLSDSGCRRLSDSE